MSRSLIENSVDPDQLDSDRIHTDFNPHDVSILIMKLHYRLTENKKFIKYKQHLCDYRNMCLY